MGVSYSKIDKLRFVRANFQKGYVLRLRSVFSTNLQIWEAIIICTSYT